MSGGSVDPAALARLLRQRTEMGAGPLFLDDDDRDALLAAARELLAAAEARPARSTGAAGQEGAGGSGTRGLDALRDAIRSGADATPPGTSPAGAKRPAAELPVLPDDYERVREIALGCTRCGLSETRTQVVFSDGVPDARVVVMGEAPGANEDRTGLPFVGAAGKLLDLMLASVDLSRERNAYICNVLKCRPPGNRNPRPEEIETCAPYLRKQLELVEPEVLLGVGTFAARWLTGSQKTLGKLRGDVHSYEGVPVVVTYHPAALLRNRGWIRASWDDLQLLRQVMEERASPRPSDPVH